jgi:hypothetical protein
MKSPAQAVGWVCATAGDTLFETSFWDEFVPSFAKSLRGRRSLIVFSTQPRQPGDSV